MYEIINIEGFQILLNQDKSSKTFKIESIIRDGFIHETRENSGIAHFVEHVVSESWKKCFKKGCSTFWTDYGSSYNAETTDNGVMYYIEGFDKDFSIMIDYICGITINPIIPDGRLNKEKQAVINEIMSDAKEDADLYDAINKTVYCNEGLRYNCDRLLQVKNLKKFNKKTVKKWIEQYYCCENIVFVISGNFDKKKIVYKLKNTIPKLKNKNKILRSKNINKVPFKRNDIFKQGNDIVYLPSKKKDATIVFLFPFKYKDPNKSEIYCDLFEMFIDSSIQSLIMYELREKLNLIYTSDVEFYYYLNGGLLNLELSTTKKDINKVFNETIKILKNLYDGKFTKKMLQNLKKQYLLDDYSDCNTNDYYTRFYGIQLMNKLCLKNENIKIYTHNEKLEMIKKITKSQMSTFIKSILDFDNLKVIYQM